MHRVILVEVPSLEAYTQKPTQFLITLVRICLSTGKKGGAFYQEESKKKQKLSLAVVRINKSGDACNARPCYNCLKLMKLVGIKKVYYSVDLNNVVCENVKDMVSIQSSSVAKYIEKLNGNDLVDVPDKYYENLLKTYFPSIIKTKNLHSFIQYNLINVLPNHKIVVKKKCVSIVDPTNRLVIKAVLVN